MRKWIWFIFQLYLLCSHAATLTGRGEALPRCWVLCQAQNPLCSPYLFCSSLSFHHLGLVTVFCLMGIILKLTDRNVEILIYWYWNKHPLQFQSCRLLAVCKSGKTWSTLHQYWVQEITAAVWLTGVLRQEHPQKYHHITSEEKRHNSSKSSDLWTLMITKAATG